MNSRTISAVITLYRMELRALLRDRRTIILSVVLPLLFMPLILFMSSRVKQSSAQKAESRSHSYAIAYGSLRGRAEPLLSQALSQAPKPSKEAKDEGDLFNASPEQKSPILAVESQNPQDDLLSGKLDTYIEAALQKDLPKPSQPAPPAEANSTQSNPNDLVFIIHYREDRLASGAAAQKLKDLLLDSRSQMRNESLSSKGFVGAPENALKVRGSDTASPDERARSRLGRYITALVLLFMLVGGGSIASDSIAGEKERGTLETLLSAGAGKSAIISAKFLIVLTATLVTTSIQVGNLYASFALGLSDASDPIAISMSAGTAGLLFLLYLPLAVLSSSILVLAFGLAKSYKEAQLYFLPISLLGPVLALAPAMPGIELRSLILIVPLINLSVAARDVLMQRVDMLGIFIAWAVTALFSFQMIRFSSRMLSAERLILSSDLDTVAAGDGDAMYQRHVLRWFSALWAFVLLATFGGSSLGLSRSLILGQMVFLGATLWIVRHYKLNPNIALSLRAPKPLVWPAVFIGAPSALMLMAAAAEFLGPLFHFSQKNISEFGKSVFPDDMPTWQLVLLIAVLPPICEELLFRGALLFGLRRRLKPVALVLTVGLVFGLFHILLFRLATTGVIGILITIVALWSGSLYPCILWHALNNIIPIVLMRVHIDERTIPRWSYGIALLALSFSFWLIWKNRDPNPAFLPMDHTPRTQRKPI